MRYGGATTVPQLLLLFYVSFMASEPGVHIPKSQESLITFLEGTRNSGHMIGGHFE